MSRCFPYPPPNYRREEKSLTESIKLQKKQETKESRKEKKKEKKEKREKRDKSKDKHERSKHREHGHKKRKYDGSTELQTEDGYQKAATKDAIEQLEKSGLTEERGLPFPMQEPCESFESTQNSSKSRKLEGPNISGGSHGSTVLRLKLPLRKHNDLKPTPVTDEPCFSGRATSKDLEATPANEESCFSGQVTSKDMKVTPAIRATSKGLKAARVIRATSRDLKATAIQATPGDLKATPAIWATSKDLKATPAIRATSEDLKSTPAIRATAKDLKATPANEKPCFSGRDTLEATPANERPSCFPDLATKASMVLELGDNAYSQSINSSKRPEAPMEQDLGGLGHSLFSSRSKKGGSKRSRELERPFRDLIVNWKPAPLLDAEAGTEDMGWLFESSRQRQESSDVHRCSVGSIGEDLSAVGSFQPRACYLPELEMYQLPYAVPF